MNVIMTLERDETVINFNDHVIQKSVTDNGIKWHLWNCIIVIKETQYYENVEI